MKKIILNEVQKEKLLESIDTDSLPIDVNDEKEHSLERLSSFLSIIVNNLEEIEEKVAEIKEYIEKDKNNNTNNVILFEPFFRDINSLADKIEHIYDNMPYEY